MKKENNSVNCLKCKHYAVTWNPQFPYACKLLGFKSASMPSVVVYDSTKKICEGFEKKTAQKANHGRAKTDAVSESVILTIGDKEERL